MPLQFVFGNSGSGKSTYLYETVIKESMKEKEKKFLIIVPEQFTMQTQRELVKLHPKKAIMNIDVLSFNRLAYRVFDDLGKNQIAVLEEMGKNLILRKVANEQENNLHLLKSNFKKVGYLSDLKSFLSEMDQYQITPEILEDMLANKNISSSFAYKLKDIIVMYRGFLDYMEGTYVTAEGILELLADCAQQSELIKGSVLILDGFTGFTPIQNKLLTVLFPLVSQIRVAITMDVREDPFQKPNLQDLFYMSRKMTQSLLRIASNTGVEVADAVYMQKEKEEYSCPRFTESEALAHLERNLFRPYGKPYEKETKDLVLWNAQNPKEELTCTAAKIHALVREKGYRYRDFAIVTGTPDTYERFAPEVFQTYEIPYFLDTKKVVTFHPLLECLRSVFEIIGNNYTYDGVFHFLKTGLTDFSGEDIALLESYALARGVRGKKWKQPWTVIPKTLGEEEVAQAESLRCRLIERFLPLETAWKDKNATVRSAIEALYAFLDAQGMEEKLLAIGARLEEEKNTERAKEFEAVYGQVIALFDKLVELLGDEKLTVKELSELFEAGFETMKVGVIPPGYDRVLFGDIERTRLEHKKIVFFIGVNDGVIPAADTKGGIISELEREELTKNGIELAPSPREKAFIQKFYLYQNLTKPKHRLYVSYYRMDMEKMGARGSYLMETLSALFPKIVMQNEMTNLFATLETDASCKEAFLNGVGDRAWETEDETWYALLGYAFERGITKEQWEKPLLTAMKEHLPERIGKDFTEALYGDTLSGSVTRLEQFSNCPFSYFAKNGLKLEKREEYALKATDTGTLLHEALRQYGEKKAEALKLAKKENRTLTSEDEEQIVSEAFGEALKKEHLDILDDNDSMQFQTIRLKQLFLRSVWAMNKQIAAGEFKPVKFEARFYGDKLDCANITLSDGKKMRLSGCIDRVDTYETDEDVYVKVTDYKSGSTKLDFTEIYAGTQLQLWVYLNAALEMLKKEQSKRVRPGGVLYYQMKDPYIDDVADEDLETELLHMHKPNGLINESDEVIEGMDTRYRDADPDKAFKSDVISIDVKKNGETKLNQALSEEQFGLLLDFTREKIKEFGDEIYEGNVNPFPKKVKKRDACTFCDYRGVCGYDEKIAGYAHEEYAEKKPETVLEELFLRKENTAGKTEGKTSQTETAKSGMAEDAMQKKSESEEPS